MNTVVPLARLLEQELTEKLKSEGKLLFDSYLLDLAGHAQPFQKLAACGVPVNEALVTAGLLEAD